MKIDNKESVVGQDPLPTFILLALDPSIATCKFGPKAIRDRWDIPVQMENVRDDEAGWFRVELKKWKGWKKRSVGEWKLVKVGVSRRRRGMTVCV